MYDGTDVALVLGGLAAGGVGMLWLVAAVVSFGLFLHRRRIGKVVDAQWWRRSAAVFSASAALCAASMISGYIVYDRFEHTRGVSNPSSHVWAVALAMACGPVAGAAASIFVLAKRQQRSNEAITASTIKD